MYETLRKLLALDRRLDELEAEVAELHEAPAEQRDNGGDDGRPRDAN